MELQLVTATTGDPVTVAEQKLHMRVTHSEDDALIGTLITAATKLVESETGRQLCTATYDLLLDGFPGSRKEFTDTARCTRRTRAIKLPRAPLQSVTSVTYTATDGTSTTLSSTAYDVVTSWSTAPDAFCGPGRIYENYNDTWPTAQDSGAAVTVRFVAGYGAPSVVPDAAKAAIKLLAANWYEHREEGYEGGLQQVPMGAQRLLNLLNTGEL